MSQSYPALFVIADGEAVGIVYHFCGTWCRDKFHTKTEDKVKAGMSADWIDGTECDECGTVLTNACACGSYDEGDCGLCNGKTEEN